MHVFLFAVPAAAPETTEGGYILFDNNRLVLYWKVECTHTPEYVHPKIFKSQESA